MNPERAILEDLNLVHPRMLAESVLRSDMQIQLGAMSLTDLRKHLAALEAKEQIVVINGEDATRIKITAAGQARLAE